MPAQSEKQQRFMRMVLAKKKGELPDKYTSDAVEKAARSMALESIRDFTKLKKKQKK